MATKVIVIECGFSSSILEMPFNNKTDALVGEEVIFKDADGKEEYGVLKQIDVDSVDEDKILFTSMVLRRATPNDIQKVESHIELAKESLLKCSGVVKKYELDMHVFRAGYSFDGTRVHFMFTADDRVDFRDLVKDLAKVLQKQIHLRQIGPRDKAKLVGGFGKCGRPLCCSTWLGKLESISMEMVRSQALESKGSAKLSGSCGKLLCCLKYEVEAYRELKRNLPGIGTVLKLKKKPNDAKVIALDILNQKLKVVFENGECTLVSALDVEKILSRGYNDRKAGRGEEETVVN